MIEVSTHIRSDIQTVWHAWTSPEHITQWNFASVEWQCPKAKNDLRPDGTFSYRMEAKDGSVGFDFEGKYIKVDAPSVIEYELGDGRLVITRFEQAGEEVRIREFFEPTGTEMDEQQRAGWQAILENFKAHVESVNGA